MTGKKRFKVMIGDRPYTILGQRSDEHMNAVIELVNIQLNQLQELAPELGQADQAILMAVNAVSDQLLKEARIMELEKELADMKSNQVIESQSNSTRIPYRKRH